MKIKRKICRNLQCENPVNEPNAAVCKSCKCSLARVGLSLLDQDKIEEEVEKIRKPKSITGDDDEHTHEGTDAIDKADGIEDEEKEYIVCPYCNARMLYKPGRELCECGEYIGDITPGMEADTGKSRGIVGCRIVDIPPRTGADTDDALKDGQAVTALRSLDGRCHLPLQGDWIKMGRWAFGREYFESAGKRKVSREHAILRYIDGAWHISYCRREDRNYSGGVENPIFINKRRLEKEENYRLQRGDEIGFAESDISDTDAAFFRAE